jgi:serine/threonine protein kinase
MTAPVAPLAEPIPGYRLIERIGRGGFGEVWKCEAPGGFLKAIKLVYGSLDAAGDDGKGAEQEMKALDRIKQIRHPFLLSLERFDIIDGQLRIVMELADRSLWDRFRECRGQSLQGIPRDELLRYLAEAAEALDMMNVEHNLQHLDVKPQNLFLVHSHVKVADFGLVKVFEGSMASVTGGVTPVYAAPETFDGRATRYSDQYSLAIVYQELLVGVRPFNGNNTRQLVMQHLSHAPNLDPLPECDRGAVGKSLSKTGSDRFPTCAAFVTALRNVADPVSFGPNKPPMTPSPRLAPPMRSVLLPSQMISRPSADPTATQSLGPSVMTMQRPVGIAISAALPQLAVEPPELTGPGALMPAVVVGLGGVGDRVVRYLRRAVVEQFGGPEWASNLRLLSVDTDPEVARSGGDLLIRMHRPSHYLAKFRDAGGLDWLPPGILYRLPRNPVTNGLRGLGRLAFLDNVRSIESRLKAELQAATDPAALAEADRRTRLGVRTNRPRVYVVATPAGGTGGGMFLDFAYLARHVLRGMGYANPDVTGVLLLPPADRTGSKAAALANTYAALTELAHFSRTDTVYEARFNPRDPAVTDRGRPFARCLCLPLPPGTDQGQRAVAAGATAGLLFRELLAPLGRVADAARPQATGTAFFDTAATYRLSWPGRRLTNRAARHLGARLLREWTAKNADSVQTPVCVWLDEQWEVRQLAPELLVGRLTVAVENVVGGPPDARFDAILAGLVEQPGHAKLDGQAITRSFNDLIELTGRPKFGLDDPPPGRLQNLIAAAASAITTEYEQKLGEMVIHFVELPQYRLAAAEEAIRQLTARLRRVAETYDSLAKSLNKEAAEIYAKLLPKIGALELAAAAKKSALAAEIVEPLRAYSRKRHQALLAGQVLTTYQWMMNGSPEYLREINTCRKRLDEAAAFLEQPPNDGGGPSPFGPGRDLFLGGRRALDEAAADLVAGLSPEEVLAFDNSVQTVVRENFRSVSVYCLESSGSTAPFADLLREQADLFLATRAESQSAAAAVFAHFAADPQAAQRTAAEAFDEAGPILAERAGTEFGVLAVPAGPAGDDFRRFVAEAVPEAELEPADSPDEVVFYRERAGLAVTDLPQFGRNAKAVCDAEADGEHIPHARADVAWKPPAAK